MKAAILSTRKLATNQRELLLNAGMSLVEQDFIAIEPVKFEIGNLPQNIIFTSQNSLKIVMKTRVKQQLPTKNIFCVGDKTAALLNTYGLKATRIANYGSDLATIIAQEYKDSEFLFFCGKMRRPDIPTTLEKHSIPLTQVEVYDTLLLPKKVERSFDGVLFFSPSAVESFCHHNSLENSTAFCIGRTTAEEAKKHGASVEIANTPSIESVIARAASYYRGAHQ